VRTDWDKFPGAHYTVGIDTVMPNGRTLQIGSIHHYRTNFSIPYDITYEDLNGEHKHAHQTTFGMSERLLGAVVGVHGDDKGLVLPPPIAPFQVVVIPIISKKSPEQVIDACKLVTDILNRSGVRTKLDDRNERPGAKYYEWEMRGVPLRLEVGPRDIANKKVVTVRRDNGEKEFMDFNPETFIEDINSLMEKINSDMNKKAWKSFEDEIRTVESIEEVKKTMDELGGIISFDWCGDESCGKDLEETAGVDVLGIQSESEDGKVCMNCGKPAKHVALMAKTY
jgi:prolyl-tRNA synthetase